MEAVQQQIGAVPQASEACIQHLTDLMRIIRRGILEMLFDIAMAIFFGIQFGCIRRERFLQDFGMLGQKILGLTARMDRGAIPDQDKAIGQEAQHMFQRLNHVGAVHPTFKMAFVKLARQRQTHGRRDAAPLALNPPQDRTLATRSPGRAEPLLKGVSEFVKKHDRYAVSPRFFLSVASPEPARLG